MKTITRTCAVDALREYFLKHVDENHSVCSVAAQRGVFCNGYRQWNDQELREKFSWIAGPRRQMTRSRLEQVIDSYQRARQEALEVPLACDAKRIDQDACRGWDEFTDSDLARFHQELLGAEVKVVPDPIPATSEPCSCANRSGA
jgi:hypothetical protein